jgi:F-type H+-transporting ATPase subunit gamma
MKGARPFVVGAQGSLLDILTPAPEDEKPATSLLVAISSDKGLCGGLNSKCAKEIKILCDGADEAAKPTLMIVGGKVRDALARTHGDYIETTVDEIYTLPITFSLASFLAESVLENQSEQYTILYNKFKSVIAFEVTPLTIKSPTVLGGSGVMDEYEFEGEKEWILADLYQYNLAATLYGCMLENSTSEQASRMTAMDSATNNATEMGAKLTIMYNRQRQAAITTELTEIVAGAESV